MRTKISLILILVSLYNVQSQQLILNGDFEQLKIDSVINWEQIAGSPDIINLNNLVKDYVWETNKRFFKGVKSRGFIGYAFDDVDSEVIGTKIIKPLMRDSIYTIKMKFLTGHSCLKGLGKITVGLTKDKLKKSEMPKAYELNTVDLISTTEQINGGEWIQLQAEYKATGEERYLFLGNFNRANQEYSKRGKDIVVEGEKTESCNYLIVDEIEILQGQQKTKGEITPELLLATIDDIAFEFGKWELKPSHFDELHDVLSKLNSREGKFIITGYTDNIGSDEANILLSKKRATSVKEYLVNKGMDKNRLIVIGKGEASPKYSNSTEYGRTKNRRVEIRIR